MATNNAGKIRWKRVAFVMVGGAVAAVLAAAAGGAGHGSYLLAKLLFPYTMLSTVWTEDTISPSAIGGAFIQWPAYRVLLDLANSPRATKASIILLHILAFLASVVWARTFPVLL